MPRYDGVIILGHPRSGTTLLRRLLNGHSRIACPGETHILNASARFIRSQQESNGLDLGVLSGLGYAGFPEAEVVAQLRDFALSFPRRFAHGRQKERWAEKTAFDAFYLPEIDLLFGDHAYFAGMVRHPLDVALSCKDFVEATGMYTDEFHSFIQATPYPMEAFARSWLKVTTELMEFGRRHPDNFVLCRYEDLVADPETILSEILDLIGESFEPNMIAAGLGNLEDVGLSDFKSFQQQSINDNSIGRWTELPEREVGRLAELLNPTMELLGYDPLPPLSAEHDREEARRRYAVRLVLSAHNERSGAGDT